MKLPLRSVLPSRVIDNNDFTVCVCKDEKTAAAIAAAVNLCGRISALNRDTADGMLRQLIDESRSAIKETK